MQNFIRFLYFSIFISLDLVVVLPKMYISLINQKLIIVLVYKFKVNLYYVSVNLGFGNFDQAKYMPGSIREVLFTEEQAKNIQAQ